MHRFPVLLCVVAAAALVPVAPARADGDPASDVLLAQDVFFPYAPNRVSKPLEQALQTTVKRAKDRGFALKVALIADVRDLGSAGQLLREPQRYADLLTTELSLNVARGRGVQGPRVLAVLPTGLGGNNLGDTAGDALEGVLPAEADGPDGLARTAAVAIGKLTRAAGRPIVMPELPAASGVRANGGGGVPAFVLFGAPVLLLVLVVVALNARLGGLDEPARPPGGSPGDPPIHAGGGAA